MKKRFDFNHFDQNKSIVVFGYHGLNNIGDDLMFITGFYDYPKIYSIKRPYKILSEVHQNYLDFFINLIINEQLVFSGGNIFNVATNFSYIKLIFFMILFFFRSLFRNKTILNSAGFNFTTSNNIQKFITFFCLKRATHIYVRDIKSYNFLIKNKFKNISFRDDIVYYQKEFVIKRFSSSEEVEGNIIWFVSKQNNSETFFLNKINKQIKKITNITFIIQDSSDLKKANDYILQNKSYKGKFNLVQYDYKNIKNIMSLIKKSKLIVTERYHGAVLAEIFSKKWVLAGDSEKLINLMINNYKLEL